MLTSPLTTYLQTSLIVSHIVREIKLKVLLKGNTKLIKGVFLYFGTQIQCGLSQQPPVRLQVDDLQVIKIEEAHSEGNISYLCLL